MTGSAEERVTVPGLTAMKNDGRKIVGVVAWDYQMARIADRADVDIVSVGDTIGVNLWGHTNPLEVTMDDLVLVSRAVRRGVQRALLSCDFPFGPLQEGTSAAVCAAIRFAKEAGADMVKLDGAGEHPEAVSAIARAGIPVFAQFGMTPQRTLRYGIDYRAMARPDAALPRGMTDELVAEAKLLEDAGASVLDLTNAGPVAGEAVARSVSIPVVGGFGGGPWLDGRVRMVNAAIGYSARAVDEPPDSYANVGRIAFDAISAYTDDVRSGRQVKSGR